MPSLILFGRRWGVGSDDFVFPSVIDLSFRAIWFLASGIILWKNYELFGCESTRHILIGFLSILQLGIVLDVLLLNSSRNGAIMETEKRDNVPKLLYFRILSELFLIFWNILTSFWYWADHHACMEDEEGLKFIFGLITFNWTLLGIQLIFLLYSFDFNGASKAPYSPFEGEELDGSPPRLQMSLPKTKYSRTWRKRLNVYCCSCCDFSGPNRDEVRDAFSEVARMCASQFGGEDLVHSDVMAGLILLSMKHRREKLIRRSTKREWSLWNADGNQTQILKEPKSVGLDTQWGGDWRSFKHLSHFLKYASAAFGWRIVVVQKENPCQDLIKNLNPSNCLPCRKYPVEVEGDNCCYLETAGIKATIEAEFQDIIYVSFKNKLFETPFFVALDHSTKSVVVGIRGSLSLNDILLDMVGWPVPIPGYPSPFKTHRGMLLACSKIRDKLERLNILPKLFSTYPEYNLVITGHSLGSGCAVILSMMLRPEFPTLRCYAYSPPGGLLSKTAAEFCDDFVISLTYGDDFVTRLGILQIERLKHSLLKVLSEARVPKYKILMGTFLCCKQRDNRNWHPHPHPSDHDHPRNDEENGNFLSRKEVVIPIHPTSALPAKAAQACSGTKYPSVEGMYPPGKIIHVRRRARNEGKCGLDMEDAGPKWVWRWADRTDFDDIIVSKRMLFDHIPLIIPKSLKYLEQMYY